MTDKREHQPRVVNRHEQNFLLYAAERENEFMAAGISYLLEEAPVLPAGPVPAQGDPARNAYLAAAQNHADWWNRQLAAAQLTFQRYQKSQCPNNNAAQEQMRRDHILGVQILCRSEKMTYTLDSATRGRIIAERDLNVAIRKLRERFQEAQATTVTDLENKLRATTLQQHEGNMELYLTAFETIYDQYNRLTAQRPANLKTPDGTLMASLLRNCAVTTTAGSMYQQEVLALEAQINQGVPVTFETIRRRLLAVHDRWVRENNVKPKRASGDSSDEDEKAHATGASTDDKTNATLSLRELQQEVQRLQQENQRLRQQRGRGRGGRGRGGGRGGRGRGGRGGRGGNRNPNIVCNKCGGKGHVKRQCPSDLADGDDEEANAHYEGWEEDSTHCTISAVEYIKFPEATLATILSDPTQSDDLITILSDNGSTCHAEPDAGNLHNYKKVEGQYLYMNAHKVKIIGRGDWVLMLRNARGNDCKVVLKEVAHVPSTRRLCSQSEIAREAWASQRKNCTFVNGAKNGEPYAFFTIGKDKFLAKPEGRLYHIQATIVPPPQPEVTAVEEDAKEPEPERAQEGEAEEDEQEAPGLVDSDAEEEDEELEEQEKVRAQTGAGRLAAAVGRRDAVATARELHTLFAHASTGKVAALIKDGVIRLPEDLAPKVCAVRPSQLACDGCGQYGGGAVRKHPKDQPRDTPNANELWYMDVSGPHSDTGKERWIAHTVSPKGMSFAVEMKKKNGTSAVILKKKQVYERLANEPMKAAAYDRGTEYMGKRFQRALRIHEVVGVPGAPDSSKGPAENRIKVSQDRGLSAWSESGAPNFLKIKAIIYANDVGNFLPSEAKDNDGRSAYEMSTGKKPDLTKVHKWGCRAYARLPKSKRRKGGRRSRRVCFVGFAPDGGDGWLFYDPDTRKFLVSRSAVFHDDVMYYKWRQDNNTGRGDKNKQDKAAGEQPTRPEKGATVYTNPERYGILPPVNVRVDKEGNIVVQRQDELEAEEPPHEEGQRGEQEEPAAQDEPAPEPGEEEDEHQEEPARQRPKRVTAKPATFDPFAYDLARSFEQANATYHGGEQAALPVPKGLRRADVVVPNGYAGLEGNKHREFYEGAMGVELKSFETNGTFQRKLRSEAARQGRTVIPSRWVFDVRCDNNGFVTKFRARLVAKGFRQRYGKDYEETFAPTPLWSSLLLLTALTLAFGWVMHQMDAEKAFQIPKLDVPIFMEPPQGTPDSNSKWVWQLLKCLYGLKQSGRYWNAHVHRFLLKLGFVQLHSDPCVYVKRNGKGKAVCAVAVHVDDFQVAAPKSKLRGLKQELSSGEHKMKDLGELSWYLGVQFRWAKNRRSVELSQADYVQETLLKYGMENCKPVSTPLQAGVHLYTPDDPPTQEEEEFMRDKDYRGVVGRIQYLAGKTRVELKQAAGELARFQEEPRKVHWQAAMRVLQYLKGTKDYVLRFDLDSGSAVMKGYSDSNHAPAGGSKDQRRSTSGQVFTLFGGTISAASRRQTVTAKSTCEAELIALASAAQEAMWLTGLLKELGINAGAMDLYCDNEGTVQVSKNRLMSRKIKHLEVDYFIMRDYIEQKKLKVLSIATDKNISDIMTKPLGRNKFTSFRAAMGVRRPTIGISK